MVVGGKASVTSHLLAKFEKRSYLKNKIENSRMSKSNFHNSNSYELGGGSSGGWFERLSSDTCCVDIDWQP